MQDNEEIPQSIEQQEKEEIFNIICEKIHIMQFVAGMDCSFTSKSRLGGEIGLDSLSFMDLDVSLSNHFNVDLNLATTDSCLERLTVEQFVELVYARKNNLPDPDFKEPTLISRVKPFLTNLFTSNQKTKE